MPLSPFRVTVAGATPKALPPTLTLRLATPATVPAVSVAVYTPLACSVTAPRVPNVLTKATV